MLSSFQFYNLKDSNVEIEVKIGRKSWRNMSDKQIGAWWDTFLKAATKFNVVPLYLLRVCHIRKKDGVVKIVGRAVLTDELKTKIWKVLDNLRLSKQLNICAAKAWERVGVNGDDNGVAIFVGSDLRAGSWLSNSSARIIRWDKNVEEFWDEAKRRGKKILKGVDKAAVIVGSSFPYVLLLLPVLAVVLFMRRFK